VHHEDIGDHLHPICIADHHVEPTCNFDYDAIHFDDEPEEPEETVAWKDMSACFVLILEWILAPTSPSLQAARAESLMTFLDPGNARYPSLAAIAKSAGCTKACLSNSLLKFKDQAGLLLGLKLNSTRQTYSNVQCALAKEGKHASDTVRRLKAGTPPP
jgi:hypothetical protein